MKKITFLIAALLFINISFAQDNTMKSEIELMQDAFGFDKKEIITEFINLDGIDADKFWSIYNEYEVQRKNMGKEKMELLYKYTMHEGAVSNMQAEKLMDKAIPMRAAEDNLILKYTKKLKKATSPLVASQFYQIEHYISDGIRFTILDNINFIQDK